MIEKCKKIFHTTIKWFKDNLCDLKTLIIFAIVVAVMSSEVWLCYLLGFIFHNGWLLGVASACWLFWLGPFTPFIPLCLAITIGIKTLLNKITKKN